MGKPKLIKTREQHIYSYSDHKDNKKKYAYRFRHTRSDGRKTDAYKQGFKTSKEASLALTKLKADLLSGNYNKVDTADMTINQLCDLYTKYKSTQWKKSTAAVVDTVIRRVRKTIGHIKVAQLNKTNYRTLFLDPQLEELNVRTVKMRHSVFSSMINFAVDEEIIDRNRIRSAKIEELKKVPRGQKKKVLTQDELNTVLQAARKTPIYECIATLAYTGMRVGEACGLKWKDIDFSKKTISIQRTVDTHGVRPPKTKNSIRTIPLPETLEEIYHFMKKERERSIFRKYAKIDGEALGEEYIFRTEYSEYRGQQSFRLYLRKIEAATGIKAHPHIMRHTYATLLIGEGYDVATVAALLGDTVTTVQTVYIHAIDERKLDASKRFDDLLKKLYKEV